MHSGLMVDIQLNTLPWSNILLITLLPIPLYVLFTALSIVASIPWLSPADTVSVCYCVPAKTPAMGIPLANVMYIGLDPKLQSMIQVPMVVYQGIQILGGSLCVGGFRRWVRRREKGKEGMEEGADAIREDERRSGTKI
jgi:solute carrier family 10 (sodium/bile acid cotransporter), member 7